MSNTLHPIMAQALQPVIQPSVRSEDPAPYNVDPSEDDIIERAMEVLRRRMHKGPAMDSPQAVRQYLMLKAAGLEREEFWCMWLNTHHHIIDVETVSTGTLSQASIYPREIVKSGLRHNAAAVILAHNHPSGLPEPSRADEFLTQTLKSALGMVDVRVLDHIIVGNDRAVSFAERGLL
jgi:DNA repair protein RadC